MNKLSQIKLPFRAVVACAAALTLSACSGAKPSASSESNGEWMKDGQIVISRPAPSVGDRLPSLAGTGIQDPIPHTLLGFMPHKQDKLPGRSGSWIYLNLKSKKIALMNGEKEIAQLPAQGLDKLKPGTFRLLHKQRSPLWRAPDSYFASRGLEVPASGDKARLRRGALGDYVLYLNEDTPIHSGPIWSEEVGGIRMAESDLSKIYYAMEVGATIEVR